MRAGDVLRAIKPRTFLVITQIMSAIENHPVGVTQVRGKCVGTNEHYAGTNRVYRVDAREITLRRYGRATMTTARSAASLPPAKDR